MYFLNAIYFRFFLAAVTSVLNIKIITSGFQTFDQ